MHRRSRQLEGRRRIDRFRGWTFQLQPRPLQQHLANVEVARGGGEMQGSLPRVRPSMDVNERT